MQMLCLMAQGDPYGVLTIKGRPPSMAELRRLCGGPTNPDPHRHYPREFKRWFDELERNGVFQWVEIVPVDAPDLRHVCAISAPRMRHDGAIAKARSAASHERWKVAGKRQSSDDLHMQNAANGADLHMQNPILHTIEAEAEEERVRGLPLPTPEERNPPKSSREREDFRIQNHFRKRAARHDA